MFNRLIYIIIMMASSGGVFSKVIKEETGEFIRYYDDINLISATYDKTNKAFSAIKSVRKYGGYFDEKLEDPHIRFYALKYLYKSQEPEHSYQWGSYLRGY